MDAPLSTPCNIQICEVTCDSFRIMWDMTPEDTARATHFFIDLSRKANRDPNRFKHRVWSFCNSSMTSHTFPPPSPRRQPAPYWCHLDSCSRFTHSARFHHPLTVRHFLISSGQHERGRKSFDFHRSLLSRWLPYTLLLGTQKTVVVPFQSLPIQAKRKMCAVNSFGPVTHLHIVSFIIYFFESGQNLTNLAAAWRRFHVNSFPCAWLNSLI